MSLPLWLYLIDVSTNLMTATILIAVFSGVASFVSGFATTFADYKETREQASGLFKKSLPTFIISITLTVLIPTKQTMYLMLGTTTAKEIITDPTVKETGGKILQIINQKLDELAVPAKEKK